MLDWKIKCSKTEKEIKSIIIDSNANDKVNIAKLMLSIPHMYIDFELEKHVKKIICIKILVQIINSALNSIKSNI